MNADEAIKAIRAWAYQTPHGTASHEVLRILRDWRLDPRSNEPIDIPAERQFNRILFWGDGDRSAEQARKLEEIFHHVLYDMLGLLQQPPHSSSDAEAKAAEKWTKEERRCYNIHIRDIVMALTGQELPPRWLDWEKKLVIKFFLTLDGRLLGSFSNQTAIRIGRRSTADVTLDDDSVSEMHAYVTVGNGKVYLADLGSRTGTKVNGKVGGRPELIDGDMLTIGLVNLRVSISEMGEENA